MAIELAQSGHHLQPSPAHPNLNIKVHWYPVLTLSTFIYYMQEEILSIATSTALQNSGLPWCYRVFSDAPNPGLYVNDIGILGVPLDALEGEHVGKAVNLGHNVSSEVTATSSSWSLDATQVISLTTARFQHCHC